MIGALKCLKVAKCYLFLEGVLTGFSSKELKEVTSLVAVKQIHQINYKENIKHCVYKKAACLGTSPHGLQTFRCFSSASDNRDIVKHDHIKQLFYVDVGDGSVGYIEYDKKEQLIVMKHTFVSKGLGGRGIGKLLAKVGNVSVFY